MLGRHYSLAPPESRVSPHIGSCLVRVRDRICSCGLACSQDLSWVVAPLKREHGGFRPAGTNLAPDWKVAEEMIRHPSPPPAAAAVKAAVGPVSFAMPTSPQKVAAMRATPIRASG